MQHKIPYVFLIISFLLAIVIWPNIHLPFNETYNYGGEYFVKNYNKHNDTLRFIIFLIISLIPFLITYSYENKSKIYSLKSFFNLEQEKTCSNKDIQFYFYIFIACCLIEFLIIDFTILISDLDLFHEGLWITSAFNYIKTNQFWQSSYSNLGLFGNYYPLIFWNFQDELTIGSVRFLEKILILFNKILLVILAKQISNNLYFKTLNKILFFIILTIFLLTTSDYFNLDQFVPRSALLIIFLNLILFSLKDFKKYSYKHFTLGLFSNLSIIWYLDIGAYINFSIISLLIIFSIKKDFKTVVSILFGVAFGWIVFFILLNPNETPDFIFNTLNIYSTIDQIHGLIYPVPFFSGDTRATRTLILFILGGLFTIFICLDKNKFNTNNKLFFLILLILSIASFKTGLSRSDSPHIKTATGPLMIILYSYFCYWLINLSKLESFIKKIEINKKIFQLIFCLVLIFNFKLYLFEKIQFFPYKIKTLITAKDREYLTNDKSHYIELIDYYKNISHDQDCVQILTDEIIIPYLLRKKTCTKYYEIWIMTPDHMQERFIQELKNNRPKIILTSKNKMFTPELNQINKYLEYEYEEYSTFKQWVFLKIKK